WGRAGQMEEAGASSSEPLGYAPNLDDWPISVYRGVVFLRRRLVNAARVDIPAKPKKIPGGSGAVSNCVTSPNPIVPRLVPLVLRLKIPKASFLESKWTPPGEPPET